LFWHCTKCNHCRKVESDIRPLLNNDPQGNPRLVDQSQPPPDGFFLTPSYKLMKRHHRDELIEEGKKDKDIKEEDFPPIFRKRKYIGPNRHWQKKPRLGAAGPTSHN
jgi:hypothetical protein